MKKGHIVFAAVVIALFLFALVCGTAAYIARTGAYVEEAGRTLSAKASDSCGSSLGIRLPLTASRCRTGRERRSCALRTPRWK